MKKTKSKKKLGSTSKTKSKLRAKVKTSIKPKAKSRTKSKSKPKTYEHHPDHYNKSEPYLIDPLAEELKDAWFKIRSFGESLGAQTIYASGRAIMFSRKVCYFFVRPKKSYLEVVIFLNEQHPNESFKVKAVSKTKFSHTFKLVHSDQVEGILTDAVRLAYQSTPEKN